MTRQISRQRMVEFLRYTGHPQEADKALRELPDVLDVKEAQDWGERHGVSRDELINMMGGSP